MMFKRSKEEVANEAALRAKIIITYNLQQVNGGNISNIGYTITQAISDGIREAIMSLINDIYTDADFEKDIGLEENK